MVARIIAALERRFDSFRYRRNRGERLRNARVEPYRGFGTRERVFVLARVLEGDPPRPADRRDRWWRNVVATVKRLESDEVPHAVVDVTVAGVAHRLIADVEGHVAAWIAPGPAESAEPWQRARFELPGAGRLPSAAVEGQLLVPTSGARFGVISDLDDTVVQTGATSLPRLVHGTLFGNVYSRLPFPGVAAFYRALHDGATGRERNPLFYVSSSPWNLYDVLDEVLRLHEIPSGPLLLRNWGVTGEEVLPTNHQEHKLESIERIFGTYPHMSFVLIGDSGQEDPEIYHDVVHRHPERVLAVYIRNVSPEPERRDAIGRLADEVLKAGSALLLADDSAAAARHAAEHGWIDPSRIPEIAGEAALEKPADEKHPTVVVEKQI